MWWGKDEDDEQPFENPFPGEMCWQYDQRMQERADAYNRGGEVLERLYEEYARKKQGH
jgi:uncharacterized Fe-S cluster-containing radical SAM superfamily protein